MTTAQDAHWKEVALRELGGTEKSFREVGLLVGRAPDTIKKLAHQAGLRRAAKTDRGGRRTLASYPILSEEHRALGIRLNNHREIQLNWNLDELARHLGANRLTIQLMELGKHDFTLSQLRKITDLLGLGLLELVAPFNSTKMEPSAHRS